MCRYKNNVLPVDSDRYPVLVPQWLTGISPGATLCVLHHTKYCVSDARFNIDLLV